ncbi:uncharacterized protein C8Q71DRAFT_863546 [Rhodofomes roseus]|uniref:Uncharacterized protein n=1 Tax=Rhodofomes roseus TaxID=34475 RepID=A0ABQ8JXY5_9APHY|nr:uncharacterized protein C8Q71DRAFT_863546 [Rhodofomes roseus]KAH9829103.1 hypothetical protein C8Q71DRAFT_863546 [Rhodofomes roseus]
MAADALVFIVTWRRTYHVARLSRQANVQASLSTLLLRDGVVYFASLFILNCICIATYFSTSTGMTYITVSLSSIILSRMLLNLREASLRADGHGASTSFNLRASKIGTIDFARAVDAFGASWNEDEDADIDEGELVDDEGLEIEMTGSETEEIGESAEA